MNTITDELVYKVHKLQDALSLAQRTLIVLEKENADLKQLIHNDISTDWIDIKDEK